MFLLNPRIGCYSLTSSHHKVFTVEFKNRLSPISMSVDEIIQYNAEDVALKITFALQVYVF